MALHRRKRGETVAAERKRLSKRQDTVAGRATKRRNTTGRTTPAVRPRATTRRRR